MPIASDVDVEGHPFIQLDLDGDGSDAVGRRDLQHAATRAVCGGDGGA